MMRNIPYIHTPDMPLNSSRPYQGEVNHIEYNQLVHDLKSPVNSLKGIIRFADTQVHDEQVKEYFYMINQCVNKLEEKIMNTLSMFHTGSGNTNLEPIDFKNILDEILISLGHIDGFAEVKLNIDIENENTFFSSKPILESVIQNLVENAIKYRNTDRNECLVNISIADYDEGVRIEVADNGIGIKEDQLPRIFDANFKSVLTDKGSNGLGLFIVKKAVEKMRGTIEVKSVEEEGTIFAIYLPNGCDRVNYVGVGEEGDLIYQ